MDLSHLFGPKKTPQQKDELLPDGKPRLPPNQYITKSWPVLSAEATPKFNENTYRFKVWGAVEQPIELSWRELLALPQVTLTADFHCVTMWSRYNNAWTGIHVREIINLVKPHSDTQFVTAHSWTNYTTNMPYSDFNDDDVLIAFQHDGEPISPDHGGPVRLIVPKLYGYKSAKWLDGFEFMPQDNPGFWEIRGYHNHGDPWQEERYW